MILGNQICNAPNSGYSICGDGRKPPYQRLCERLIGAPCVWHLEYFSIIQRGLMWLDAMPVEEDIATLYLTQ